MIIGIDASRANHEKKSGVEWYAFFIIQELKKIIPSDVRVILYSDVALIGDLAVLPQNWTQKILKWPPHRFWTQIRLSREMVLHPVDVLFIPAHVPPLIHPKNTVMMVHDVAAIHFPETYNWFERWYSIASAKYAVKNLPAVIVPSQSVKDDLLKLESNVNPHKISIIHHGVNPIFFDRSIPVQLKIPPEDYILFVGRLEEKKNTKRLVEAFTIAKQRGLTFDLILVGQPGYGYEAIKKSIEASSSKHWIRQIPWLNDTDLVSMMRGAAMFVFPGLSEGFGLPILEAFAAGVPVIASNAGSLPEVGGDAVLYIDPLDVNQLVDAIMKLADNRAERERLIALGTERVKQFSWTKAAQETFDVFESLVG